MKQLLQLKKQLEKALELLIITIITLLVLTVLWQVASRYVLSSPSSWTEELAKILLVWGSLLGAAVAYSEKSHLGVDYFVGKLKEKARIKVEFLVHTLIALASGYMLIYGGSTLVQNAFKYSQTTAALKLCWGYIYLALPLCGIFFVIFAIEFMLESAVKLSSLTKEEV